MLRLRRGVRATRCSRTQSSTPAATASTRAGCRKSARRRARRLLAADGAPARRRGRFARAARDGLNYVVDDELYPSIESFRLALGSLVGRELHARRTSGLAPLWPGCAIGWHAPPFAGAMKRPGARLRRGRPVEAARAGRGASASSSTTASIATRSSRRPAPPRRRRGSTSAERGSRSLAARRAAARASRREHAAAAEPAARERLARARARVRFPAATPPRCSRSSRRRRRHGRAWGTHERMQALRALVAGVQHERERRLRVLLPLVLDREGDAHSDLSLDSAAELLHAAITAEPRARRGARGVRGPARASVAKIALRGELLMSRRRRRPLRRPRAGAAAPRRRRLHRLPSAAAAAAARSGGGTPPRLEDEVRALAARSFQAIAIFR